MPPSTSPAAERVLSALAAQLLAKIQGGADYWNTLTRVGRPPSWVGFDVEHVQQGEGNCQALIRPGLEPIAEETTGSYEGQLEVWVLAIARYAPPSTSPYQQNPEQDQQSRQNELIEDFRKAIMSDVGLGGVAFNAEIRSVDRAPYIEGWVAMEMLLVVSYSALKGGA